MWRDSLPRPKVRVVTGYVRLEDHPRRPDEYYALGQKLGHSLGQQDLACFYERVPYLWLSKFLEKLPPLQPPLSWSKGDNPSKNSLEYHCIQHQKFAWLARAANEDQEADSFVWIDYGIASQPGFNADDLQSFLKRIRRGDFAMPGCWEQMIPDPLDDYPCWRFCGSVMIVPRSDCHRMLELVQAMARTYVRALKKVTWEVNTLARCEPFLKKVGLRWYKADHNVTQFTRYE